MTYPNRNKTGLCTLMPIRFAIVGVLPLLLLSSSATHSTTPLREIHVSPDVTLGLGGVVLDDEDVALDDLAGSVSWTGISALPDAADLDAYHRTPDGDVLFSLDTAVELTGGLIAMPGDVVRFDGAAFTLEFDASAAGAPAGANVDAVSVIENDDLLLSFDITVNLGGVIVDDEDLVRFDGAGFTLFFDGSSSGVETTQDVDAVHHVDANGHLLLSFDGTGIVVGVGFDDEDVVEFDPSGMGWSGVYDGSAEHAGWSQGGIDALFAVDASAGSVPTGRGLSGMPLTVERSGSSVTLRWSPSCNPDDEDYAVYRGDIGDTAGLIALDPPFDCTTGGATSITIPPGPGNHFYVVVPQGSQREGSYGTDRNGVERSPSAAACKPQFIGTCY